MLGLFAFRALEPDLFSMQDYWSKPVSPVATFASGKTYRLTLDRRLEAGREWIAVTSEWSRSFPYGVGRNFLALFAIEDFESVEVCVRLLRRQP